MKEVNKKPVWLWLVLCLPLVFIAYFVISLSEGNIDPASVSEVDVVAPDGESFTFSEGEDVPFYVNVYLEGDPLTGPVRDIENETPIEVVIKQKSVDTAFELYAEANTNGCFFRNKEGKYFSVPQTFAIELLQREECAYVYDKAGYTLPTLSFKTGDEESAVLPESYAWQYKDIAGTAVEDVKTQTASERQTFPFYSDVGFALSFSVPPTEHTITFYDENGSALNISDPSSLLFTNDTYLRAVVEAKWDESANYAGGSASYDFDLLYDVLPEIIRSSDTAKVGDVVCIGFRHLSENESISLSTQLITSELKVNYGEDGSAFALIPVSTENEAGVYTLMFTVGSIEKPIDITVTKDESKFDTATMDPEKYNSYLKPEYREKLASLLASLENSDTEQMITSGSRFSKPTDGSVLYDFGDDLLINGVAEGYIVNGVEYRTDNAGSVRAAQRGVVVYAGEDEVYGNMIIVDHGCGILSRYCGLGTLGKAVGDTVQDGEIIGTPGVSGLVYTENSAKISTLHFSVTVCGIPVNPNTLFANGITIAS